MKAKELLSFVINFNISELCHMVHTPKEKCLKDYGKVWTEWYRDYLRVDEVCILDEDSDYLAVYVAEEETWITPELDRLNVCYVSDRLRFRRIYLIKVE